MAKSDIHVELSALAGDARAWACVGDSHRRLRHAVEDLSLSVEDFHPEAEGRFEAHSAFADLMEQLQVQLGRAERAAMSGAEALNDIRKRYAENERASDALASRLLRDLDEIGRGQ